MLQQTENKDYPKFIRRHFHINTPYFGAWSKYGWKKDTWGLGLNKQRVDMLADAGMTCVISYGKDIEKEYTLSAKKVQIYPVEQIKNTKVEVYIVPKSALNYRKKT